MTNSATAAWLARISRPDSTTRVASRTASVRGDGGSEVFFAGAPADDLGDLAGAQRPPRIHPEVDDPQQRSERVNGSGAFGVHLFARGEQHLRSGADAVVLTWMTQPGHLQREHGLGDALGVERVRFPGSAPGTSIHTCGLDDLVKARLLDHARAGWDDR